MTQINTVSFTQKEADKMTYTLLKLALDIYFEYTGWLALEDVYCNVGGVGAGLESSSSSRGDGKATGPDRRGPGRTGDSEGRDRLLSRELVKPRRPRAYDAACARGSIAHL